MVAELLALALTTFVVWATDAIWLETIVASHREPQCPYAQIILRQWQDVEMADVVQVIYARAQEQMLTCVVDWLQASVNHLLLT